LPDIDFYIGGGIAFRNMRCCLGVAQQPLIPLFGQDDMTSANFSVTDESQSSFEDMSSEIVFEFEIMLRYIG